MGESESTLLPDSAKEAIGASRERLARSIDAGDAESIIGASKDLAECVAKCVLDALGGSYGSDTPMPRLAAMAMASVEIGANHPALQRLGGSLISAATAIAELRNSDGTGHGRSAPSNLATAEAQFVGAVTSVWSSFLLGKAELSLASSARIDRALVDIGGGRVYSRGQLKAHLDELDLDKAPKGVQRKVGLAVARRWVVNGTFMPRLDVIDPLAEGSADFPDPFQEGVVEGLLLDSAGRVKISPEHARIAVEILMRLRPRQRQETLRTLADHVEDAAPSPTFERASQLEVASVLRSLAVEHRRRDPGGSLSRIAARIEQLTSQAGLEIEP